MMEISNLIPHIEALIFASEKPLTTLEITDLINNAFGFMEDKIMLDQIESAIEGILEKYKAEFYPFEVRESGGGWQFLTKKDFHKTVAQLNGEKFLKRLSTAALETLSIVAYKQPVTKSEIEAIRGVSSDYAIQKLLEKDLIVITGRNEHLPGQPLVYATSKNFMDYFGLNSTDDLPKLKEVFDDTIVVPTAVSESAGAAPAAEGEATEEEATPSANGTHLNGTELTFSEEGEENEQYAAGQEDMDAAEGEYEQETDESEIAEEAEALDEEAGEVLDEIAEEGYDEEETSNEEGFEEEETYITPEEGEDDTYADDDSTSFKVDEDGELIEEENIQEEEEEEMESEEDEEPDEEEDEEEAGEEDEEEADEEEDETDEEQEDEADEDEADEEEADDEDEDTDDEANDKDEEKK
jgi:segregation and condensation protein B